MKKFFLLSSAAAILVFTFSSPHVYAKNIPPIRQAERQATKETLRQLRHESGEDIRKRLEEKRATMSQRLQEKREQFKQRLNELGDERKKRILERLIQMYTHKNNRWTTHLLHVLDQLERILDKLTVRRNRAAENGVDTAAAAEAIATARKAIDEARLIVEDQAAKEYIIEITDEATLRVAAQTTNQQLRSDLTTVRELVVAARRAVGEAFQALKEAIIASRQLSPMPTKVQ